MGFSVAETIKSITDHVFRLKGQDLAKPVTIIAPNISMLQSINRALLATGRPVLNVRVETFRRHVVRLTEGHFLNSGVPLLTDDQARLFISDILAGFKLSYFSAARDFHSYAGCFHRTIGDLRLGAPEDSLKKALGAFGTKGGELFQVYEKYRKVKKDFADYADMLNACPVTDEHLVLFPGVVDDLTLLEKKALEKVPNKTFIEFEPAGEKPQVSLKDYLYHTQEIRGAFREAVCGNVPFDRVAIIAPGDYLTPVMEEAGRLGIPVFCPQGEELVTTQTSVFEAVLEVIDSGYEYDALKMFFQLTDRFAALKALIDSGVAVGRDLIQKTAAGLYRERKKERYEKLLKQIERFEKVEKLQKTPHAFGKAVLDIFITASHQKSIITAVLDDLERIMPGIDYDHWKEYACERLARLRAKSGERAGSVFLTTEFLPGSFDHVFVLGIKEGSFPPRYREDPLLLDHEREEINNVTGGALGTARDKNIKATENLDLTLACAEKAWAGCFPSMDVVSGDEQFPSHYLIDIVKEQKGNDKLSRDEYTQALAEVKQPWNIDEPDRCLDYTEWSACHLLGGTDGFVNHVMKTQEAALAHHQAYSAYWQSMFNEYGGYVEADGFVLLDSPPAFSATELEKFMTCPYRWFLEKPLRVKALDEPETLERPDALTIGNILHETLERYMSGFKGGKHNPAALYRQLEKTIRRYAAESGEIHSIYMEKLQSDMVKLADNFLKHEEMYVKDGRRPRLFEFAFGTRNDEKPVPMKIGRHSFGFSGSIDRVDIDGKKAYILDYKSSAANSYKEVGFEQGQRLQPALYAEAFMLLAGKKMKIKEVVAGYLPLKKNSKEFVVAHDSERQKALRDFVGFVFSAIRQGYFFTTGNCQYCDYAAICGKGIALSSEHKRKGALKHSGVKEIAEAFEKFGEIS